MPEKAISPVGTMVTVAVPTLVASTIETAITESDCGVVVVMLEGVLAVGTVVGAVLGALVVGNVRRICHAGQRKIVRHSSYLCASMESRAGMLRLRLSFAVAKLNPRSA